jgi:DNA-directed RNA polymerase III subunit RPC5
LFVKDTGSATKLASPLNNDEYLDAISIPRIEPGSKGKRKLPLTRKQMAEMEEDSETEGDDNAN